MTGISRDLRAALPAMRTSDDDADRLAYSRDLWPRHHLAVRAGRPAPGLPGAIAWPESTDDVARLVRWARDRGASLVPFGAGSGVCAGVLPRGDAIVVDLKRMGRIRRIDPRAPCVEVEAGHMGLPLERSLARGGFTLGHFPSSILCSTVGGWIAARSAGQCSSRYGKIEDMVVALECVTGAGEVVELRRRTSAPDLVPLVVGSEGTLAVVTAATLRLHPAPAARAFGAWSFADTRRAWEAMRAMLQDGLRPAVARVYDPLDARLARHARPARAATDPPRRSGLHAPGLGGAALRVLLRRPGALSALIRSRVAERALGGAMLLVVFEGEDDAAAQRDLLRARGTAERATGTWLGDGPARAWLERRYAVSYRQAPLFADGLFVDTMEVAAPWSRVGEVYEAVRRALGGDALVTAHFSHAYPDGCCIYFSFAGSADAALAADRGWDAACEATYDRAWRLALSAATGAGGVLAHHHGVGRSKAPRLQAELGQGIEVVRALMRAFDPARILNPGNLVPDTPTAPERPAAAPARAPVEIDRVSLLASVDGATELGALERVLGEAGLTLRAGDAGGAASVGDWLAAGAPGARDRWLDPADQIVAGLEATLSGGRRLRLRPAPRRSVGPDLTALLLGARGRYGRIDRAWLRVHRVEGARPTSAPFEHARDPAPNAGEAAIL